MLQPIGNQLIPYATKGINVVQKFTDKWNKLGPATQKNSREIRGSGSVGRARLMGFGKISTGISTEISNFGRLSGAITRLTGASGFSGIAKIMTGPFGIAAAGVITAAVLIYKNWDRIEPILQKTGQRFENFWNTVQPQLEPFIELTKEAATYLQETFGPVIDDVFSFAGGIYCRNI